MSSRLLLPALLCTPLLLLPAQTPAPVAPSPPSAPSTPAAIAPGPGSTLTPEQTANIMKQLDLLETQITKGRTEILGTALAKFRSAMSSPKDAVDLYVDCYRLENFERRDLKQTDFQAWKENNEARLKDEEFVKGLMLQLEYLVITIQAQDIEEQKDMGPLVTALQNFIPKAIAAVQETVKHTASGAVEQKNGGRPGGGGGGGGRGPGGPGGPGGRGGPAFTGGGALGAALRQSVKGTEFSQAYLLENFLKRQEWAYAPLEIADIYQQVIFPYYLEVKPTEVAAQWDTRINAEMALRKITMSESEFAVFFKERQPELAWQKATFLYSHRINAIQAMADMLKIVRENPAHAEAPNWLKELRQAVTDAQPAPEPSPSTTNLPPPPGS